VYVRVVRFVVYGAGAIGGVVGARLALAGFGVTLIARGAHLAAIREHGLRFESPEGTEMLPLDAVESPAEAAIGDDDVVVLATKSQHTGDAVAELALAAGPSTRVACMQNGVANERLASRHFANVYGVCVMCPAEHLEPGVVVAQSAPVTGIFDIGRFPDGADAVAREVAEAFTTAACVSEAREDVMRWKYGKLLMNVANIIEATCADGTGRGELISRARAESMEVLHAAGIEFVGREEDEERRGDLLNMREVAGRRRVGSSTRQSLVRQTGNVESDYLNGEIVLLGREHGIATPVNELLQEVGRRAALERLEPCTLRADELLAQLPDA
jgi:2-dehydropantoate 2-reductase